MKWKLDEHDSGNPKGPDERLYKAAKAFKADVVVMTQACDLEHDKVADVVLCPCFPLSAYRLAWAKAEEARNNKPTDKNWASFCNDIKDGYIWNLFILDAMQDSSVSTEHRIVDFHSLHTVPRAFLDTLLIERGTPRLRLKPPYREHLSQSFARYFMRVGLPSPVTKAW